MGKNDFLAPKAIANRMKSKGLQKLRWYCQLCQKQCRDENGFQCHLTSDSHKRQMEVFGMNPKRMLEGFSQEFENAFLGLMRRSHPNSRVLANSVYNEYVADKTHIHMNSTRWLTLTDFITYLGREGKCKVEETEKGWYITLIMKDPKKTAEDEARSQRERAELAEDERARRQLEAQIQRAKRAKLEAGQEEEEETVPPEAHELRRSDSDAPVTIALGSSRTAAVHQEVTARAATAPGFDDAGEPGIAAPHKPRPKSKLEELMERDRLRKATDSAVNASVNAPADTLHWVVKGLVVKVLSKALKEAGYYKVKAVVKRVLPPSKGRVIAELEVLTDGALLQVDEAELETVLPQPGGRVCIVRGTHKGCAATMREVDTHRFRALVELTSGDYKGDELWFEYEDICKVHAR